MIDLVTHPSHYNHDGRKECWDEWIDKFGSDYAIIICLGCVDKYLYRAGTKEGNSRNQDINKAWTFYNKALSIMEDYQCFNFKIVDMLDIVDKELQNA